jgi:hypothetical protein
MFKETILSKYLVLKSVTILAVTLLGLGFAIAGDLKVFSGTFQDGAVMKWVCPPGAAGTIPFQFTTPEGGQYSAQVSCGNPV